jgi:hypothetical protein
MMRDLRAGLAADRDVSRLSRVREALKVARTEAEEDPTLDAALRVPTVKAAGETTTIMEMFSVEIAAVKEVAREEVREAARDRVVREVVKDLTTMIDLITTKTEEDPRLLVVVPETTTTLMTIELLVKDTTIKIMTIPAKIEMAEATSTMLVGDSLVNNKIIMIVMITNLATITEDPGEMTTIKAIV